MNSKIEWVKSQKGKSLRVLTATDYTMARLLDEAGVPLLLVGDSLGMVSLGYPDTTHVTLDDMLHHAKAVMRARPKACVIIDMPYQSYAMPSEALLNAQKLMATGADGVKVEGACIEVIRTLTEYEIPVMGHLGMLPQSIHEEGGYKIKGKSSAEREKLILDAKLIAEAGVFSMVLELVVPEVAEAVTHQVLVPTIGIGAGKGCDGQVLVTHDLIGLFPWFKPKHVHPLAEVSEAISVAAKNYLQ
ncbi:MAG: 3-methyl-2-oxobutanoate hydroxymethyltransferase [Verrucomicrobiota bacterium]